MTRPADEAGSDRDCGHDAGAYVLGALDAHELERFRLHMQGCVLCREEVASLRTVVQALPMAAPQLAVDRRLRRRVMADVRAERRASARERGREAAYGPPRGVRLAIAGAAAAVLAAAAIVAGVQLASRGSGHARVIRALVIPSSARAFVRLEAGRAKLIVVGMPAPPAGDIYEVWLKRGTGAPIPTSALFGVTSSGAADVDVPGDLHGVRAVLVTPERFGGSERPTHEPVIVAKFA
jgi:anti-sigma-K factor RskA